MAAPLHAMRGGKGGDSLLGGADHYIKPVYEREIGPLWKAYVGRRVACHFHFGINRPDNAGSENLCADFQAFPSPGEQEAKDIEASNIHFVNAPAVGDDKAGVQCSVFVPIGEFFEDREAMQLRVVKSIVGLRPVEKCLVGRRDFAEGVRPGEPLAVRLDREFDPFNLSRLGRASTAVEDQLPSELVEPTPQVMDEIAYDHSNTALEGVRHRSDPKDVKTRIRIELGAKLDLVAFPVEHRHQFAFKSVAMLIRPLNLGSRSTKVDGHDYVSF
jgi:hypothetical protein